MEARSPRPEALVVMGSFGRSGGGGRRESERALSAMSAAVTSVTHSAPVVVAEISRTGARLEGRDLPKEGESLSLSIGKLHAFGAVRWREPASCGVQFEARIPDDIVAQLRRDPKSAPVAKALIDAQEALEDWETGFAR